MGIKERIGKLFARRERVLVFVDYEYWYFTYKNRYWIKPDPAEWLARIRESYEIERAVFFANFALLGASEEKERLQNLPQAIVLDTGEAGYYRKDMTDFVMLDEIYQATYENRSIKHYILFTGDGHFTSVLNYLIRIRKKKVAIHSVIESCSRRLIAAASETEFYPTNRELYHSCRRMIVQNMAYVVDHDEITPTFLTTVEAVSRRYNIPTELVKNSLQQMLDEGYAVQAERRMDFRKYIKVISANWDKLIADGIWDPNETT